jgi:acyl-CoA reductase-like NAD-dependent aldehyde dehydrogenase
MYIIPFCHVLLVLLRCSKLRNAGQTCVSANRVLVQSKVYDKFASLVKAAFEKVKCGNGLDPDVAVGMNWCKL